MQRRSFLQLAAGGTAAALGMGAGWQRWQEITPSVQYPGRAEGHYLRDRSRLPAPECWWRCSRSSSQTFSA